MTTSAHQSKSTPRIKLRSSSKSTSVSPAKPQRPVLRNHYGSSLVKGTATLPGAGAPLGSQNSRQGHLVKRAFTNELAKVFKMRSRADTLSGLESIASKVIKLARAGSIPAAREVFDRVDGRPAQMIIGDPENPLVFKNISELSDSELEQIARGFTVDGEATRVE